MNAVEVIVFMLIAAVGLVALGAAAGVGTMLDTMRDTDPDLYAEWMRRRKARKGVKSCGKDRFNRR